MDRADPVRFLNLDLAWPEFVMINLERRADGSLTLARVPRLVEVLGGEAVGTPRPVDPLAPPPQVATTPDCACDLFVTDPVHHGIWRFDVCAGEAVRLPVLRGPGAAPGALKTPTGLVIANTPTGQRLYVAEAGNHRIQAIDLATQQPMGVWSQADPYAAPVHGSDPGQLTAPWDLAIDRAGDVYVVDRGNARVQRFSWRGEVRAEFWARIATAPDRPRRPRRIAIAGEAGTERLFILDDDASEDGPRVVIANVADDPLPLVSWPVGAEMPEPVALAVLEEEETVYVAGATGAIARFTFEGTLLAVMPGHGRPLAALTAGCAGDLLAASGDGLPIDRYLPEGGFLPSGWFQVGPFATEGTALAWHRWRVAADQLGANAHLQLFTRAADADPLVPPPDPPLGTADEPFAGWFALPADERDVLVLSDRVRQTLAEGPPPPGQRDDEGGRQPAHVWLGGMLTGDGLASPVLRQMRLDQTPETALAALPAMYRDGARRRLPLDLLIAHIESELGSVRAALADMPRLVDPAGTPAGWLPWLASWLDLTLDEEWSETEQREAIAGAMALHARRGTVAGVRALLERDAGVAARIEEPGAMVNLFALDERAVLGFTTGLAPGDAQGVILGTTAMLGASELIPAEETGVPLFSDVAHRFRVLVYAVELLDPQTRPRIQRILDREKPAHTVYELCEIGPRMRVGLQARLGIDSIVGGPAPAQPLDEGGALGVDAVLPADPSWAGRRIGKGSRVGIAL
jgi:phage tail-like protein